MSEERIQFGKVPYRVVASGVLAGLNRSEIAVYTVLAAHVCGTDWMATPAVSTLAELAGISRRTAQRAIRKLVKKGLISVADQSAQHYPNTYLIATQRRHPGGAPGALQGRHLSDASGGAAAPSRGVKIGRQGRHPGDARTEEQQLQQQLRLTPAPAAAGVEIPGPSKAMTDALIRAGISEPTRSELGALSGLTPEIVDAVGSFARGRGVGPGAIVLDLRARAEAITAGQASRSWHDAEVEGQSRSRQETIDRAREHEQRNVADLKMLDEAGKLDALVAEAIDRMPKWMSDNLKSHDPFVSKTVRASVLQVHRKENERD